MSRTVCICILLITFIPAIYCEAHPDYYTYYRVNFLKSNNTETTGYLEVFPYKANIEYDQKLLPKGTDILSLIKEYRDDADSLFVTTVTEEFAGLHFRLSDTDRYIKIRQIKKITLIEDISSTGTGGYQVNASAELENKEYAVLKKGVCAELHRNQDGLILISSNPNYTQLDLYLYACLIDGENNLNEYIHPFLSEQEVGGFDKKMEQLIFQKNTEQSNLMINTLRQCKQSWLTMAKYLENSASILPEGKDNAIDTLNVLAQQCEQNIAKIISFNKNKSYPEDEESRNNLYISLRQCIFPYLSFENKFGNADDNTTWEAYLLKRGIIIKFLLRD